MTVKHWNTGAAAARFRSQAASRKRQASSSGLSMRGDRGKPTAAALRPELEASSKGGPAKSQAPSSKPQASSIKQGGPAHNQAASLVKIKI